MRGLVPVISATLLTTVMLAGPNSRSSASSIEDQNRTQTVMVTSVRGEMTAMGSGVIVKSGHGLTVLTAAHTVATGILSVTTISRQALTVLRVKLIPGFDLAVITTSIPFGIFPPAVVARPVADERVYVWGHPARKAFVRADGKILSLTPTFPDGPANGRFSITCTACDAGDSGGGVFNLDGKLTGILEGAWSNDAGVVSSIECEPVEPAMSFLD